MDNIFDSKQPIKPAFEENNNLIVLASDNNYAPYLGVCIESIAENSLNTLNYDIVVLETNIHTYYKNKMINMLKARKNISLRFYNLGIFGDYFELLNSKTTAYFTAATYYRMYAPEIFINYDRMFYLDCGLVVVGDFSELLKAEFGKSLLIAVPDVTVQGVAYSPLNKVIWRCDDYLRDVLKIKDYKKYFQAGVMVFDLKNLRKFNFTEKCLDKLKTIDRPRWVDQDILNSILYGHVKYAKLKYNYTYHLQFSENNYQIETIKKVDPDLYEQIKNINEMKPHIIHYTSSKKPWLFPYLKYADLWWYYASFTPFYNELMKKMILYFAPDMGLRTKNENNTVVKDCLICKKLQLKYIKYKLLTRLSWGKKHNHWKQKRNELKTRIKQARNFLREK